MAKVHPRMLDASASCKQQVYTLWMKSLILNTKGCTVFDSDGEIVYRVDNYDQKCSSPVYIMDAMGKVLYTIIKKKFSMVGKWEGHRWSEKLDKRPAGGRFRVAKVMGMKRLMGHLIGHYSLCKAHVINGSLDGICEYVMESEIGKSSSSYSCKIFDDFGQLAAEVKRKVSGSGVVLGEDVLAMVVEPHVDNSLIMALVVIFGLIHNIL